MKTVKNKELGLRGKHLSMIGILFFLALESFGSNKLTDLNNLIMNADPHHYFLAIFIALFLILATWQFFSSRAEKKGFKKLFSLRRNIRRFKLRRQLLNDSLMPNRRTTEIKKEEFTDNNVRIIARDELTNLRFEKTDVLDDKDQINTRMNKLITAMRLGNVAKRKVKIYFKDLADKKCIETTVWYADTMHVTLKGGLVLPVSSIYHINI